MKEVNDDIDQFEAFLYDFNHEEPELNHHFIEGGYAREILMRKGTWWTSLIHKTEHPFAILEGKVSVFSGNDGYQLLEAGHKGMTKPGTRRILFIHEDCLWVTFHRTEIKPKSDSKKDILEAVDLIGDAIIEKHENKYLGGILKQNKLLKTWHGRQSESEQLA